MISSTRWIETPMTTILCDDDRASLVELQWLLDSAVRNFVATGGIPNTLEGRVLVLVDFGDTESRADDTGTTTLTVVVDSFLLPESPQHFSTVAEALTEVKLWHAEEMVWWEPESQFSKYKIVPGTEDSVIAAMNKPKRKRST
jgi:hypothetical protein